jgi:outer membrane protein assembly factor BamB
MQNNFLRSLLAILAVLCTMYADGKIYFLSEAEGESTIIEAGPKFRVVARNSIGEKCKASIAVSNGNLFIRSEQHLFCIGGK